MHIDIIEQAWEVANNFHKGQKYGTGNTPYIYHIGKVFIEASKAVEGFDQNKKTRILLTAILHDILEDTEMKEYYLADKFSVKVLFNVRALTKNNSIKKDERMIDSLARIKECGEDASIVKLCDRIANLSQSPPDNWELEWIKDYYNESCLILNKLGKSNEYLSERLELKIKLYKEKYLN